MDDNGTEVTKGWLQRCSDATKLVFEAGKEVEVSTLMVTDANGHRLKKSKARGRWVLITLSDTGAPCIRFAFSPN